MLHSFGHLVQHGAAKLYSTVLDDVESAILRLPCRCKFQLLGQYLETWKFPPETICWSRNLAPCTAVERVRRAQFPCSVCAKVSNWKPAILLPCTYINEVPRTGKMCSLYRFFSHTIYYYWAEKCRSFCRCSLYHDGVQLYFGLSLYFLSSSHTNYLHQ